MSTDKKSYKDTLNLPKTDFPMEAKLVQNEPARLAKWQQINLYQKLMEARKDSPKWVLHDGPPFANGDIHIGHVINKTLKDVIQRFRSMQGNQTPYIPGWDCHGLPIEHKIQESLGSKWRDLPVTEKRRECYAYAEKFVNIQSVQFQRLGILGAWDRPYLTMAPDYEASTLEVFAKFVEAGLVYKKLKPVPWSISNQTALADAELEYKDVEDPSVYVEFAVVDSEKLRTIFGVSHGYPFNLLVWTTTPWTLPANLAIAINPDVDYVAVAYERNGKNHIAVVAEELLPNLIMREKGKPVIYLEKISSAVKGQQLLDAHVEYRHPFANRAGRLLPALYVTTTDGTGLVHTAPGHGEDDYLTGQNNNLEVYCPVMATGKFDDTVPEWIRGKNVFEANPIITAKLRELDVLFDEVKITHSYPHDWRSKKPVIQRATEQWFVAVDKAFDVSSTGVSPVPHGQDARATLRALALSAINTSITFIPDWGRARLLGMLQSRPDWCISRQRTWGLPIPVFYNEQGQPLLTPDSVRAVARRFAEKGSAAWFTDSPAELLGNHDPGPDFPKDKLRKEQDIFDVWFESGSSWHYVLFGGGNTDRDAVFAKIENGIASELRAHFNSENVSEFQVRIDRKTGEVNATRHGAPLDAKTVGRISAQSVKQALLRVIRHEEGANALKFPADMYLEGSDQHRGWFQLSLLPALGATGRPPYKQVLTHGFIVKPDGTKVSKSDKEYVTAMKEIETHGADLLRLWCCSVDYQGDIPTSPQAIKEFGDKYRKIRNTLRYLLSNLYDFDPTSSFILHPSSFPQSSLDGWMLAELDTLIEQTTQAYDRYELHRAFRLLHDFCSVQISSIYGNAMKDRLYCDAPDSPLRRRCQAVMHRMALTLTKLLAPMVVFTADETWEHIPHKPEADAALASVHLALLPKPSGQSISDEQREEWKLLMDLRDSALSQLDTLKKTVGLNKAVEAEIVYKIDDDLLRRKLQAYGADLEDLAGCGHYRFEEKTPGGPAVQVRIVDAREIYKPCARSWKRRPDVGHDPDYPDLSLRDAAAVKARPT